LRWVALLNLSSLSEAAGCNQRNFGQFPHA